MSKRNLMYYLSGMIFAVYLFFLSGISNIVYALNFNLTGYEIIGSVIFSTLFIAFILKKSSNELYNYVYAAIPAIVLIVGLIYGVVINRNIYDTSFDGQAYQGEAIATLIEGWNPITSPDSSNENTFVTEGGHERWLNAYPKASWYNSVAIHRLTGNFKDTKFFGMSIMLAVFAAALSVVNRFKFNENNFFDQSIKYLLSVFVSLNPILLVQSTTLNLDGQVYGFMILLFATMFHLYKSYTDKSEKSWIYYVNIFIILTVLINIKTAGLVYGVLFFMAYGLFVAIENHREIKRLLITFITSIVVGIGVLGFNPYITNIQLYGNPLFPQFGENSFNYSENTPSNYRDRNNVQVFLSSLFFKTDQVFLDGEGEEAELKLPFTVYESEIDSLKNSQLKKGGLGPLFSGSLILAFIAWLLSLTDFYTNLISGNILHNKKIDTKNIKYIITSLFLTAVFFVTFVLTKTSNTFRYIPHLWLIVGIWIGYGFYAKKIGSKTFATIALLTGIVNSIMFSTVYFANQIENDRLYDQNIATLKESGDSYELYFENHTPTRVILNENNIDYEKSTEEIQCPPFRDDLSVAPQGLVNLTKGCIITNPTIQ